jgi:hypothetical protein
MIWNGDLARTVIIEPMPVPKKHMIRAIRLPHRSAKMPHGREKSPKQRYMGKPSFRTSSRFMFNEKTSGIANAGKVSS